MKKVINLIPAAAILVLATMFWLILSSNKAPSDTSKVPLNKPVAEFSLPLVFHENGTLTDKDLSKGSSILIISASWCGACRKEHPDLVKFKKANPDVKMYSIGFKDKASKVRGWLTEEGNPYEKSAYDKDGLTSRETFSVKGIPAAYVIKDGKILHHKSGKVTLEDLEKDFVPLLK